MWPRERSSFPCSEKAPTLRRCLGSHSPGTSEMQRSFKKKKKIRTEEGLQILKDFVTVIAYNSLASGDKRINSYLKN